MVRSTAEAGQSIAGHAGVWYRKSLPCDPQAIEQFRNNPKLSLHDLILRIIDAEDPKSPMMPIDLRFKILDVVDEVVDPELPGWKKKG